MNENTDTTFSRREALKKASITAGLTLAGSGIVHAQSNSSTSIHFVEAGIEHDLSLLDSQDYPYPSVANDEFREYTVNTEEGVLRVKDTAREEVKRVFRERSNVVKRNGYKPIPATVCGTQLEKWVTTKLDAATLRPTEQLTLAEPYQPPNVTVERSGTTVHLSGSGSGTNVDSLEDGALSLPKQEVAIKVRTVDEGAAPRKQVNGEVIPEWKRAVPLTEKRITSSIQPKVRIRNYGRLAVDT